MGEVDRNWAYRAQQIQGDINLHLAILDSDRYDESTKLHVTALLQAEQYLLAEAQYNSGL